MTQHFLLQVHCAVFGLGDSSYAKYNFAGKKLFRRLKQLGANMMMPLGLGDDQHEIGIDGGFVPWKEGLWQYVQENEMFEVSHKVIYEFHVLSSRSTSLNVTFPGRYL